MGSSSDLSSITSKLLFLAVLLLLLGSFISLSDPIDITEPQEGRMVRLSPFLARFDDRGLESSSEPMRVRSIGLFIGKTMKINTNQSLTCQDPCRDPCRDLPHSVGSPNLEFCGKPKPRILLAKSGYYDSPTTHFCKRTY